MQRLHLVCWLHPCYNISILPLALHCIISIASLNRFNISIFKIFAEIYILLHDKERFFQKLSQWWKQKNCFFAEIFLNKFKLRIWSCKIITYLLTTISLERRRRLNVKQTLRSSRSQMFFKKSVLGNFAWRFQACNFIKKRLQHRCFPMKFAKFLRTPIFTEHLQWLLLAQKTSRKPTAHLVCV